MSEKLSPEAMRELVDDLATRVATEVAAAMLAVSVPRRRTKREIAAELADSLGCDAMVILWSCHRKGKTVAQRHASGNALACKGLVSWAWDQQEEADDSGDSDE
jgi:hypothetical protein